MKVDVGKTFDVVFKLIVWFFIYVITGAMILSYSPDMPITELLSFANTVLIAVLLLDARFGKS